MPPPEKLVRALKKNPNIDNPWAVANWIKGREKKKKKKKEVIGMGSLQAILRDGVKKESDRIVREAATVTAKSAVVREGHIVDVVLITEGLGNRRNLNYYGPEAIASAPVMFEGKPCFLNHPSESEERDIPERRVQDKCGYFKNCKTETREGVLACVGELHFDFSEVGEQAYLKCCTALHYSQEFPGLDSEYVGLSINACGDTERRTVKWEDETLEVNYVKQFSSATSCDIVTSPARGGKILSLVECAAGRPTKEDDMKSKLRMLLEAARTAQKEADSVKDDLKKKNVKTAEATKAWDTFLEAAKAEAYQDEDESEDEDEDGDEAKKKEDETEKKEDESEDEAEKKEADDAGDDGDMDDAGAPPTHTVTSHKVTVKKTGKMAQVKKDDEEKEDESENDEKMESHRIAVEALIEKAELELDEELTKRVKRLSLSEAKREIASLKTFKESIVRKAAKAFEVPVATFSKMSESSKGTTCGNDVFSGCVR